MFDLHRHDEFSRFDGYGKAKELAELCVEYGYKSLCTTNHGNTNGLIQTYKACKEYGLKAILGVEGYFLPVYKEKERGTHLILIAKNLQGYKNLNTIQYLGEQQKYHNPIWDFKMLEKYHEGLICSTACVAGYLAKCILADDLNLAEKFLLKMKKIFADDFYVEIQPYVVSDVGMQEKVNREALKLAHKLKIKCILTSDSHRGRKEDFPTYMKMHEISGHDFADIEATYKERYMPASDEMQKRYYDMHRADYETDEACYKDITEMEEAIDEIENKCELNYLDELPLKLPKLSSGEESDKIIIDKIKDGLKKRGKLNKKYLARCKEEFEVIKFHGFSDYFLIVADYVNWAKTNGINVGPGRGSVCNCLIAYALGITEVDSLLFNLDFRRFLRKDKSKYPDIDLDFETCRRQEVIEYLCKKYKGHAARISSYGLYKVDNLINDLTKKCGLPTDESVDEEVVKRNREEIKQIKKFVNSCIDEEVLNADKLLNSSDGKYFNAQYDNILIHFQKLFNKLRFIGTHAAGVAITGGNLLDYSSLTIDKDGNLFTSYDLNDIEEINVIKFDILGLKTMESIGNLRKATKITVDYDEIIKDEKLLERFRNGDCDGIFQFEKNSARKILKQINCNCFEDVVAGSSMNRPGPLSLKMPENYAANKSDIATAQKSPFYKFTSETYGAIVYQEQVQIICVEIGGLSWPEADKIMKLMKNATANARELEATNKAKKELGDKFIAGALKNGYTEETAKNIFENILVYAFNKGHAVGYSLISMEEMFYKTYYPNEYWFAKLKYAKNDEEYARFSEKAVADGSVIFLPHVNYSHAKTELRQMEGENVLQQGLCDVKGVGEKAAEIIAYEREQNGIFKNFDDFYDRCKGKAVTSRVIDLLIEVGALEFKKSTYITRVKKYNIALYSRA